MHQSGIARLALSRIAARLILLALLVAFAAGCSPTPTATPTQPLWSTQTPWLRDTPTVAATVTAVVPTSVVVTPLAMSPTTTQVRPAPSSVPPPPTTVAPAATPVPPTATPPPPTATPVTPPPTPALLPTPYPTPTREPYCLATSGRLRLYAGPATSYPVVLVLGVSEEVRPLARTPQGAWVQVVTLDDIQGWFQLDLAYCYNVDMSRLIVVVPPATPVPIPLPPTPTPVSTPTPTPIVIVDWRGEYFVNPNLSGAPALVRNDATINFNWGTGSPGANIPADNFSVRWTRDLTFDSGTYRWQVQVDDGVRLWIDGALLIDEWRPATGVYTKDVALTAGRHSIRVEYVEFTGGARVVVAWERLVDSFPDYRGEYYNNEDLLGSPVVVRNDPVLDFIWGQDPPDPRITQGTFSARWTGRRTIMSGNYRLLAESDDGVRVWINNVLMIDAWRPGIVSAEVLMHIPSSGPQEVRVEYFQRGGAARLHVWWIAQRGPTPQ